MLNSFEFTFDEAYPNLIFIRKGPFQHSINISFLYLQDIVFGLAVSLSGVVNLFAEIDQTLVLFLEVILCDDFVRCNSCEILVYLCEFTLEIFDFIVNFLGFYKVLALDHFVFYTLPVCLAILKLLFFHEDLHLLIRNLFDLFCEVSLGLLCLLKQILIMDHVVLGLDKLLEHLFSFVNALKLDVVSLLYLLHYHLYLHLHVLNRLFLSYQSIINNSIFICRILQLLNLINFPIQRNDGVISPPQLILL